MKSPSPKISRAEGGGRLWRAACLISLILLFACSALAETGPFLDYLHVEANEGDSSGGHAALRFDRYTFHFQHEEEGIIRIRRYDSDAFDYVYAKLGNRPIHQSRIAVAADTYRFIEDSFSRFLMTQDAQIEYRDALRRDVRLLEALLARQRGGDGFIGLPAAGYFLAAQGTRGGVRVASASAASPALLALREAVGARYGADFLEQRISALSEEISRHDLAGAAQAPPDLSPDRCPTPHASAAGRFDHVAHELVSLNVLQGALPLQGGSYWESADPALVLTEKEMAALTAYAGELEKDLVRLVQSRRTDRGYPLLVGMARLCAVRESVARGRLVLLDLFDAPVASGPAGGEPPYLGELEREFRRVFQKRRAEFLSAGGGREAVYTSLERAGNLLLETARVKKTGGSLRALPSPSLPARGARFAPSLPDGAEAAVLEREVALAKESERRYADLLNSRYAYDLFDRNCVTELFSIVNGSMAQLCGMARGGRCSDLQVREESARRLGGYIDGRKGLVFIPALSAEEVGDRYRVASRSETPSHRQERMALMTEKEPALQVFLRESNTFTSTIYRPGADDSFFIFFTDNAAPLRPVFGAFNVLAGLGETLYGLVTLPARGARHVVAGVKGIAFSIPELFFISIRKGSMGYVERTSAAAGSASP